jgi:glycosyltransferase involved in cell wall biosynthesis
VLVVIPAWNEPGSVATVINEVMSAIPAADILVVGDGSHDDTADVARAAGAAVARLPFNLGVGGAMPTGFRDAQAGGYRVLVQVEADGQHDATEILRLVSQLDEADLVLGARFSGVRGPRTAALGNGSPPP